jgi:Peptidase family S41
MIIFAMILATRGIAQNAGSPGEKISGAVLRADLAMLKDTLQKIHPGLYRYKSKQFVDHIFDSCSASIRDSMSTPEFYALVCFAIASFEDGHSNARLSKEFLSDYLNQVKVFPAMTMFIHDRAFIFCCNQNIDLAGAELLSINGIPMSGIIQTLFKYIPSDGNIASHKNWEMPEFFPLLFNFVYGEKNEFDIKYKSQAGVIKSATLKADFLKKMICGNPFPRPTKYLDLVYKDNIAVITLRTFFNGFLEHTGENFKNFLDSAFSDIKQKGIKKLLIDLRGNQGGNDGNGILLYAWLSQKEFIYYASQETTSEKFTKSGHPNLGIQQPIENNFPGTVYFLIDGRSFSATAEFAAIARSNDRGKFIGDECGGGYYGNTSGDDITLNLPGSPISCRIPMIKYTLDVKKAKPGEYGVMPDFPVERTIMDLIDGKDTQLSYAQELVAKEK